MRRLTVRCFAKINTVLRVLGRRPDGYHDLDTEFVSLALADTLTLEPGDGFELEVEGAPAADVPVADNLVLRAATALRDEVGARALPGARFRLEKRIPAAAGLGGGSSDAAGALQGLVRLHGLRVPDDVLARLALGVGSDVPYFLVGGRQRGTGRGERLVTLPDRPPADVLLLKPRFPLSTKLVFETHAALVASGEFRGGLLTTRKVSTTLGAEPWWESASHVLHDDLAAAAVALAPAVGEVARRAEDAFPEGLVGMTGSGPTLFVLFPRGAGEAAARASDLFPDVDCVLTRTLGGDEYRATRFVDAS